MSDKSYIYLDSVASASDPRFMVADDFANPSATHDAGRDAFALLEEATETFTKLIGAKRPSEIIWTSGATESNNIAILGIARALKKKSNFNSKNKIVVLAIEHESSLMPALHLKEEGFDVQVVPVDSNGFLKFQKYVNMVDKNTALVVCQHSNTEIGTIQNIKEFSEIAHENGSSFHCDCVGSLGWAPINMQDLGVDSASFSGHKIGAPKGVGALYLRANTPCEPMFFGGSQAGGLRPGTISVALVLSMVKAAVYHIDNLSKNLEHFQKLNKFLYKEIQKTDGVKFTVDSIENSNIRLLNVVHLTFENETTENLILNYGKKGIIVSGGPACSAEHYEPSHVLTALGLSNKEISGALRISFSEKTTINDLQALIEGLTRVRP